MATDDQGSVLPPISSSMRTMWKACQRKVFFRYVAGIEPNAQQSPARAIGKAFHIGVEAWRNDAGSTLALSGADTILARDLLAAGHSKETVALEQARMAAYLTGYFARWADSERPGKWEQEVRLDPTGELAFIDSLFIDHKGQTWIWEDKTTGVPFADDLAMILPMDEQLLNYALLLRGAGHKVAGAVYRQTLKTRKEPLKPKKEALGDFRMRMIDEYTAPAENGDHNPKYRELVVVFDEANLREYTNDKHLTDYEIRNSLKNHHQLGDFRRNTFQCQGKFGACDYLALCSKRTDEGAKCFKPKRSNLDGGEFQKSIWGDSYQTAWANSGSDSNSTAIADCDTDAWAYE